MTYEQIVSEVRTRFMGADVREIPGRLAFQFNITGEGEGAFYVEVLDGALSIEPYEYYDRDVAMTMSSDDLMRILNKKMDPIAAYTLGRLHVEGDLSKALEINRFL